MAKVHGKSGVFKIDGTEGGALVDISSSVKSVTESLPAELADITALGDSGHKSVPGLLNGTLTLDLFWDAAASNVDAIFGAAALGQAATRSFEWGPEGSTTGKVKYSGEVWVASYEITGSVDDVVSATVELQIDGVATRGTFA